jgi:hypothetical protein
MELIETQIVPVYVADLEFANKAQRRDARNEAGPA